MNPQFLLCLLSLFLANTSPKAISPYCMTFDSNNNCIACLSDLMIDNLNQCALYTPVQGCKIYDALTNTCSKCLQGRMLTGVICPLLPPNCQSSYNVLTCTVCNPGYLLLDSTNCYSQNITNCPAGSLPYNDSNLKTSYCKPLPIRNCQSINKLSAVCDSCFTVYQLLNGICLKTTIITPCVKGVCDCSKGYLFNDFCYVIPLNNCLFSYNNFICDVCADKYTLDGNDCAPLLKANDPGCIELDETKTVCKTCKITYVMNPSNLCVFNFQICSQKNCQQSDCPANFQFFQGNCLAVDMHCTHYDFSKSPPLCTACQSQYIYSSIAGSCVKQYTCLQPLAVIGPNGNCQLCFTGYQIDSSTQTCVKLPANCLTLDCSTCEKEATQVASSCIFQIYYCNHYNSFGYCDQCLGGYTLQKHTCTLIVVNCIVYTQYDQSTCETCASGYHLDQFDSKCYRNQLGCLVYGTGQGCLLCANGQALYYDRCVLLDVNCVSLTPAGTCTSCKNNLFAFGSRCVYYTPFCIDYGVDNICNNTFTGFTLTPPSAASLQSYNNYVSTTMSAGPATGSGSALLPGTAGITVISGAYYYGTVDNTAQQTQYISAGSGSYSQGGVPQFLPDAGVSNKIFGAKFDANGLVVQCGGIYSVLAGQCVINTQWCVWYNVMGTCQSCEKGYDLDEKNSCVERSEKTCSSVGNVGECLVSASGYAVINGACYSVTVLAASSISYGYFIYTSTSISINWPLLPNCVIQYIISTCFQCSPGFTLLNNTCVLYRANCNNYSFYGICTTCESQQFVLLLGECRLIGCVGNFNPTTKVCSNCPSGTIYMMGICVANPIPNGLVYGNKTCLQCIAGYTYNKMSSKCVRINTNYCQVGDTASANCITCIYGYFKYNNKCIKKINNCNTYDSAYLCQECAYGYYPTNSASTCTQLPKNCLALDSTLSCSKCSTNYKLYTQDGIVMCQYTINYCKIYNSNSNCIKCLPGFVLQQNACRSMRCLTFSNFKCTSCLGSYTLISGDCVDPNCQSRDKTLPELCVTCTAPYVSVNATCVIQIMHCAAYKGVLCVQCDTGFSVQNNLCLQEVVNCKATEQKCQQTCIQLPAACLAISCTTSLCSNCKVGYKLCAGFCLLLPMGCSSMECSMKCLDCVSGYVFNSDKTKCQTKINIANCLSVDVNGLCTKCSQYYDVDNGACSASNCITFSSNKAICSICSTGYLLGVNGICVIGKCQTPSSDNSNCLQCLPGYTKQVINQIQLCTLLNCVTVNTMTLTCSQCNTGYTMSNDINGICTIKNCLTYDQVTYACTDCVDQFVLASNICTTCDTLTQIYCAGKCVQLLPGCATMTCANYCLTCLPLYVSNGKGNCNPLIIPNCITYNPLKNLCASCDTSTYLTLDGTCSPLPFCCLAMSGTTCISCRDECYLSTISICTANPPNCSKATPMGKCTNCIHPFSLQNGFCVTLVANCLSYNQNGCNSCSLYYYLDPISLLCIHYPQGCLTFDPVHLVCLSCSSLYTYNPTSSTCTPKSNNIPGCLSYDADLNCLECGYRYYLSKYTCLTYPDYCVNVDIMGNCLSCAFGSKMADNVCVGTTTRQLNCDQFNSTTMLCEKCGIGYTFCGDSGICVANDPSCLSLSSDGVTCINCQLNYELVAGQCLAYGVGKQILPNGGMTCLAGYSPNGKECVRTRDSLVKLSLSSNVGYSYSSGSLLAAPNIGSTALWMPNSQLGEYLTIVTYDIPNIVFQVSIKGNDHGWVTAYILQFRNNADSPLICWNSCQFITGNGDGVNETTLTLVQPIVMTELRIYPMTWHNTIVMQIEVWVSPVQ